MRYPYNSQGTAPNSALQNKLQRGTEPHACSGRKPYRADVARPRAGLQETRQTSRLTCLSPSLPELPWHGHKSVSALADLPLRRRHVSCVARSLALGSIWLTSLRQPCVAYHASVSGRCLVTSCHQSVTFAEVACVQNPQHRASLPQGLSEEALKEALQLPCIWVESQDPQESRCQEVEREVSVATNRPALATVQSISPVP